MATQAERRAELRQRQAEREERAARRIRLARIAQLAETPYVLAEAGDLTRFVDRERTEMIEHLALAAIRAEPDGLDASLLPDAVLEHIVVRGLVAVFRGRVVERGQQ